jgi:SAM-dependent methyltransferase
VTPKTGYQEDLAYIHDVGFGVFARHAAATILNMLRQSGTMRGKVVDLGCGTGILAQELVAAGYDVLGVDYSAAMLRIARRRAPAARFRRASFLSTPLPSCVAVTAVGEIFNYLFDAENTVEALRSLFERVRHALRPGGLFVFDIAQSGRAGGSGKRQRIAQGEDWATLVESEDDATTRTLTRYITAFRRIGKLYRRSEELHRLRLYEVRDLLILLRNRGFKVKRLRTYGEFEFPRGWAALAARKPR